MSWKDTINAGMYRVTGHVLTSETQEQRQAAIRSAAEHAREQTAERHRRRAAKQRERRAEKRRLAAERKAAQRAERRAEVAAAREEQEQKQRNRLLANFDDELLTTVERVQPRTMTATPKLAALVEATRYIVRNKVPGDIVECGVWRGGSMQAIALTLMSLGETDRELHLFDTYEGMPPPTEEDQRTTEEGSVSAEQLLAESEKDSWMWAIAGLEDVQQAMAEVEYPADKVHFHPGLVEDTTPGQAPGTISLLRLDTDWYASTKHELEHLYERLSPGGVLILDDYGDWAGARKATDDWLAQTGEPIFLAPMGSGRIGIKPLTSQG